MTKTQIIEAISNMDVSDEKLSLISTFASKRDAELVALVCAWLSNDFNGEFYAAKKVIFGIMDGNPEKYIESYPSQFGIAEKPSDLCFFRCFTYGKLDVLIRKYCEVLRCYGDLETCFNEMLLHPARKHKSKYIHEVMADAFSCGTLLPSRESNGTFYRYSLLYYWLAVKLRLWKDFAAGKSLLPCTDKTFDSAFKCGLIKRKMKSTLPNTITLTELSKRILGQKDFYKMYEFLNLQDGRIS